MDSPLAKYVPVDNIKLKMGNLLAKHVPVANTKIKVVNLLLAKHVSVVNIKSKMGNPLARHAAPADTIPTTTPWLVPFVVPASITTKKINLQKHLACCAHLENSLQTVVTTSVTTIPSTIANSARWANIVHRAPRFAKYVQLGTNPSKTQHQTKRLV